MSMKINIRRKRLSMCDNPLPKPTMILFRFFHVRMSRSTRTTRNKRILRSGKKDRVKLPPLAKTAKLSTLSKRTSSTTLVNTIVPSRAFQPSPQYPLQPRP